MCLIVNRKPLLLVTVIFSEMTARKSRKYANIQDREAGPSLGPSAEKYTCTVRHETVLVTYYYYYLLFNCQN